QYPTFAYDDTGLLCVSGEGPFPAFPKATWSWLAQTGESLNTAVLGTRRLGWTVVTGVPNAFMKHGYCATTQKNNPGSYFVPLTEAIGQDLQVTGKELRAIGSGAFHPNARGQALTYSLTRPVVCAALYGNGQCNGIAPSPPR
ncbi:MAG TPA: hypothetical protein VK425_09900, partial [Acidimicrobiales bacterium]|nr:hypothetical protein [Acidimicrobiales bacterium]